MSFNMYNFLYPSMMSIRYGGQLLGYTPLLTNDANFWSTKLAPHDAFFTTSFEWSLLGCSCHETWFPSGINKVFWLQPNCSKLSSSNTLIKSVKPLNPPMSNLIFNFNKCFGNYEIYPNTIKFDPSIYYWKYKTITRKLVFLIEQIWLYDIAWK